MKQEHLLKVASFIISNFEDNCRLSDMARLSGCTYSHSIEIKDMMVINEIIEPTIETKDMFNKKFVLTEKGKLIQSNMKDIINILNEVNSK
mgnify:CR=1 FL=1